MPDYTPNETTVTFRTATEQLGQPTTAVTLDLPTNLAQWFKGGNQPGNWQNHMADVLRFYIDTTDVAEADAELAARAGQPDHAPTL
jgi:uncharacterized protein (DUF4415 family)